MTLRQKKIKVETTDQNITSFGGLTLLVKAIENSNFFHKLESIFPDQIRGFGPVGTIKSLLYLILSGGSCVSDIDMLDNDNGFKTAIGIDSFPKQNTISINIQKYSKLQNLLSDYLFECAVNYYKQNNIKHVVLDIDSTLIKNKKNQSKLCYEKYKAYNPMFIVDEKNSLTLMGKMRNGNASPKNDIYEMLINVHKRLKKAGISIAIRIDAAGYQKKIIEYLIDNCIPYSVTGEMSESKRKYFDSIPDEQWIEIDKGAKSATICYDQIGIIGKEIPLKLVAFRNEKTEYDLLEGRYNYHYILTGSKGDIKELITFHRRRGNAENVFKDMKQEYLLSKMPFDQIESNGLFMQIIIAAYNLFKIFKGTLLKSEWRKHTIRVIRHRLLRSSAIIRKQARTLKMIICNSNPYKDDLITMAEMSQFTKILS